MSGSGDDKGIACDFIKIERKKEGKKERKASKKEGKNKNV